MADNVIADPGAGGATFASDDLGGVHYPRNKLIHGVDGTNDGDVATTNPFPVRDYLVSPQTTHASSAGVAAGGQADLDSAQITSSKTGQILMVMPAASVPWKAELKTVLNGVASSVLATWFSHQQAAMTLPRGFVSQAESATAGLDGFRVTLTNLDPNDAADLYCTFFYDEV